MFGPEFQKRLQLFEASRLNLRLNFYIDLNIVLKISESSIEFDSKTSILYVSIDPHFKILKSLKSVKINDESEDFQLKNLLSNQVKNGDTIIERIQAARILKDVYSDDIIETLQDVILHDRFYGVGKEVTNTFGAYRDKNNFSKSDKAYQSLVSLTIEKGKFTGLNNHVKRAILKNIGSFERIDSIKLLEDILEDATIDSDFIKSAAAVALGKSCKKASSQEKKRISLILQEIINTSDSFQSVIATGALDGLVELSNDNNSDDKEIYLEVAKVVLLNTLESRDYFIRAKSSKLLGKFLTSKIDSSDSEIKDVNQKVFYRLRDLLKDERRKIKMNACEALSDEDAKFSKFPDNMTFESIQLLVEIAREDLDGFVRRKAETSANHIREWIHSWSSNPLFIDEK